MTPKVIMLFLISFILLLDSVENAAVIKPTLGSIRLVNGDNSCSGRVEIYTDDWGNVCDLNTVEGNMICIEVGCGPLSAIKTNAYFGEGSGLLLTDELNCFGNESAVIDCEWGNHTDACDHSNDVGVICDPIVRLQGSSSICSGRVEIFHNKVWGTVCDNGWDFVDAAMVCKERGCGKPTAVYSNAAPYGQGTGQIWMEGLGCTGRETSVKDCVFNGWGVTTCTHADDVGVVCSEVALVDGADSCSGRVEVLYASWGWGTICDSGWNILGGDVICRELDCGYALSVTSGSSFKRGSGPIWTYDTNCAGNEAHLKTCIAVEKTNKCNHNNDVGVVCRKAKVVSNSNRCYGTLAVRYNDNWGSICHNNWNFVNAIVACRELGCGPFVTAYTASALGAGSGEIALDGLQCTGSESSLRECAFPGINSICTHSTDAGVYCKELRLVDGDSVCSGRVEILYNNRWGTICDDVWDMKEANVICRELGCGSPVDVKKASFFGGGIGPIWKDDVGCTGTEVSLFSCPSTSWGSHNCDHTKDAGVVCREVKLVGTDNPCQGTLQVYHDGQWGSVCHHSWDIADGIVLCRELGCGGNVQALPNAMFGVASGPIWMDNLRCTSEESNLRNCNFDGWGIHSCIHAYDAGIICKDIRTVLRIKVKVDSDVNPNSQTIKDTIMNKLKQEIQEMGDFTIRWRIQPDIKQVFHEKSLFQP